MPSTPAQTKSHPRPTRSDRRPCGPTVSKSRKAVQGDAPDAVVEVSDHADEPGSLETLLTLREGAADDQVLDVPRIDVHQVDEFADDESGEVVRSDASERILPSQGEGLARIAPDNRLGHILPRSGNDVRSLVASAPSSAPSSPRRAGASDCSQGKDSVDSGRIKSAVTDWSERRMTSEVRVRIADASALVSSEADRDILPCQAKAAIGSIRSLLAI